jgi:hypothetical protein
MAHRTEASTGNPLPLNSMYEGRREHETDTEAALLLSAEPCNVVHSAASCNDDSDEELRTYGLIGTSQTSEEIEKDLQESERFHSESLSAIDVCEFAGLLCCVGCFMPLHVCQILCCRCGHEPKHQAWGKMGRKFEAAVTAMRDMSTLTDSNRRPMNVNTIKCRLCVARLVTDPPLGRIPLWAPMLPNDVGCAKNQVAPGPAGAEWFFPTSARSCLLRCCCCPTPKGDPQRLPRLGDPRLLMLYFHGGAFCACSPMTHRDTIMRIIHATGDLVVLAPNYR